MLHFIVYLLLLDYAILGGAIAANNAKRVAPSPGYVQKINNDLSQVDLDFRQFDNDLREWDGTYSGSFTIQNDFANLDSAVKTATTDIQNAGGPVSSSESQFVFNYLQNTLEPDVKNFAAAIASRQSQGDLGEYESELRTDVDRLCSALAGLVPPNEKLQALSICQEINNDLSTPPGD